MERTDPDTRLEAYRGTRHFASLDGLRCLAILPVIWHHSTLRPPAGVLGKGPLGVNLFFAISGFLITTLLVRERSRKGQIDLRQFYARRTLRIFPIYYLVLAGFVLFMAWVAPQSAQREQFFANLPYFATYTSNWFVAHRVSHAIVFVFAWSLATEEQFYLTWPWALRLSRGWVVPGGVMVLLLASDLAAERGWLLPLLSAGSLARRMISSIAAPICLGSLAALAAHYRRGHQLLAWALGRRQSSWVILVVLAGLVAVDRTPLLLVDATLAAWVVACSLREDHWLAPLLRWRPVAHIGRVSYAMYLLHVPVIGAVKFVFPAETAVVPRFLTSFALTVLAATLCFWFVEAPLLRFKDRLRG